MMAQMTIYSPDALIEKLQKLGDVDEYAPKMLNEGIKPLKEAIRQNAQKHKDTGEMVTSIKDSKPKKKKDGSWNKNTFFSGYDRNRKPTPSDPKGVANARKAMSLEYGTIKQPARPFIRPAIVKTEQECINTMQEVFNREVAPK